MARRSLVYQIARWSIRLDDKTAPMRPDSMTSAISLTGVSSVMVTGFGVMISPTLRLCSRLKSKATLSGPARNVSKRPRFYSVPISAR